MDKSVPAYNAVIVRCVLKTAADGLDIHALLRESGVPDSVLTSEYGMVTSSAYLRLWERAEFRQPAPDSGLRISTTYHLGKHGIFDYLFSTAATVGAGLDTVRRAGIAMATNHRYTVRTDELRGEQTLALELVEGDGRGAELTVQASFASTVARIRHGSGRPVSPSRITLRQKPPRSHRSFAEAFGTDRIDFDAPADTLTLRTADLNLPLPTADPALAQIVERYATMMATPLLCEPTWPDRVQRTLAHALAERDATLEAVARRLAVSPRTLQRRLAESGTTWRRELDLARRSVAGTVAETTTQSALAYRLGYSDARALRRAARRWKSDIAGETAMEGDLDSRRTG
ncbi:AraC family transcriptional regulator [Nocardia cerradoensis]|uniref:AraC family transcriptional regulator n=1 Tax=Nocardia cerradoensis TaxID=85688 RepID=UPI000687CF26|nr:AraC family transcriptional regulator ligand-binding domain-containing protein [Nocardia cerradoensis]NKY46914.1 AraC family transcriptional regulator [Nocardia cerradoensis]